MRLDKYISKHLRCGSREARLLIAQGEVEINGTVLRDNLASVTELTDIVCKGESVRKSDAHYLMLNKPAGCVSATRDPEHQTVIELLDEPFSDELHIAGRLDKASTGLLILTNDGRWSRYLTEPVMSIPKRYLVKTEKVIDPEIGKQFKDGFYFAFEDITTLPSELEILSDRSAIVTIYEGKYHQIKRMFHAVGNRITSLHRLSIGSLQLDLELQPGEYRSLTAQEITAAKSLCSE